ncbi:MAG: Mut7-C RNAse domain-containing protein [Myxococcota bacterium]
MQVRIRVYEELNDHLSPTRRKLRFPLELDDRATVRDALAAIGVPAEEVDLVLVDGRSVHQDAPLHDGAHLSAYPVFESFDVAGTTRVRDAPLRDLCFTVDDDLEALAGRLEAGGFVVTHRAGRSETGWLADAGARVVLTRDPTLADRHPLDRLYVVRSDPPEEQLAEVLRRFQLDT